MPKSTAFTTDSLPFLVRILELVEGVLLECSVGLMEIFCTVWTELPNFVVQIPLSVSGKTSGS